MKFGEKMRTETEIMLEIERLKKAIPDCQRILLKGYNKNVFKTLCASRERLYTLKWVLE